MTYIQWRVLSDIESGTRENEVITPWSQITDAKPYSVGSGYRTGHRWPDAGAKHLGENLDARLRYGGNDYFSNTPSGT
jgi:hypothetical protein